jgi:hypothetical protein
MAAFAGHFTHVRAVVRIACQLRCPFGYLRKSSVTSHATGRVHIVFGRRGFVAAAAGDARVLMMIGKKSIFCGTRSVSAAGRRNEEDNRE